MTEHSGAAREVDEADRLEQETPVSEADEPTLFPSRMATSWEADEADRLDQSIAVPLPDDDETAEPTSDDARFPAEQ